MAGFTFQREPRSFFQEALQRVVEDYKQRRLDAKSDDDGGPPTPGRPGARRAYLREYLRWLKPHRNALGAVFLLALVVAGLQMIEPLFIRFIVDHISSTRGSITAPG